MLLCDCNLYWDLVYILTQSSTEFRSSLVLIVHWDASSARGLIKHSSNGKMPWKKSSCSMSPDEFWLLVEGRSAYLQKALVDGMHRQVLQPGRMAHISLLSVWILDNRLYLPCNKSSILEFWLQILPTTIFACLKICYSSAAQLTHLHSADMTHSNDCFLKIDLKASLKSFASFYKQCIMIWQSSGARLTFSWQRVVAGLSTAMSLQAVTQ